MLWIFNSRVILSPCSRSYHSSAKTLPWLPFLPNKNSICTEFCKALQDLNSESMPQTLKKKNKRTKKQMHTKCNSQFPPSICFIVLLQGSSVWGKHSMSFGTPIVLLHNNNPGTHSRPPLSYSQHPVPCPISWVSPSPWPCKLWCLRRERPTWRETHGQCLSIYFTTLIAFCKGPGSTASPEGVKGDGSQLGTCFFLSFCPSTDLRVLIFQLIIRKSCPTKVPNGIGDFRWQWVPHLSRYSSVSCRMDYKACWKKEQQRARHSMWSVSFLS